MTTTLTKVLLSASASLLMLTSTAANAHARWIVPSHTNLSGNNAHVINIDMSISNELFNPHYGFLMKSKWQQGDRVTPAQLQMYKPDHSLAENLPFENLQLKSVAAVRLQQTGTFHLRLQQSPVHFVTYQNQDKSKGKAFGLRGKAKLPKNVTNVKGVRYLPTLDTFVSRNKLTKPTSFNQGLELIPQSHPNDLFVGESTRFQLQLNGKPVQQSIELAVVQGNTRYRNNRNIQKVTTDKNGWFEVVWQGAGMYLIEAELDVDSTQQGFDIDTYALFTTLEVNPS